MLNKKEKTTPLSRVSLALQKVYNQCKKGSTPLPPTTAQKMAAVIAGLAVAGASLLTMAILLILHHGYRHRQGGPEPIEGWKRFFRPSDVGNFHSCNHGTWILSFSVLGAVCFFCAWVCAMASS